MKLLIKLFLATIFILSIQECKKDIQGSASKNEEKIDTIFSQVYLGKFSQVNLGTNTVEIENYFYTLTNIRDESGLYYFSIIVSDEFGIEKTRYSFSNGSYLYARRLIKTNDNNLLVVGMGVKDDDNGRYVYILKTSPSGEKIFEKSYIYKKDITIKGQEGYNVTESSNGEIVITGYREVGYSNSGGYDVLFIKTDESGNLLVSKSFGGSTSDSYDYGYNIKPTYDNNYILLCTINDQICLLKADSNGNEVLRKFYGGDSYSLVSYDFCQTNDNGYLILGLNRVSDNASDLYLMKIDKNLVKEYTKTININSFDEGKCVIQTEDNSFYLVGRTGTSGEYSKSLLIKMDSKCNTLWTLTYGNYGVLDCGFSIIPYINSFVLSGSTYDSNDGLGVYLNRIKEK